MHTVLIVDGELSFCNHINRLIEWDSLHLLCAGIVVNCDEAYKIAMEKRPDIVIADIHMPDMNGLDLVMRIQKSGLACKFIVFSEEKAFDYVYKAIKLGCNDFLLKPVDKTELTASLKRICSIFTPSGNDKAQKVLQNPRLLLRRQFMQNIARNEISSRVSGIKALSSQFGYHLKEAPAQLGTLWLTHSSAICGLRKYIMEKLVCAFRNEIKPVCYEFEMINDNHDVLFLLNYPDNTLHERLNSFLYKANLIIQPYPDFHFAFGLGRLCNMDDAGSVAQSYQSAKQAIASRIINGFNRIIDANSDFVISDSPDYPKNTNAWKEINISMDILDQKRLREAIALLCRQTEHYFLHNPAMVYNWYKDTIVTIFNKFKNTHIDSRQSIPKTHELIENFTSIFTLTQYLTDTCASTMDRYLEFEKSKDNKTIQAAKRFICENIHRHLDLDTVANNVYLSPSYFGILFSKKTGTTFTDYLYEKRMGKASEYLQDIQYNISEIAGMTGYKDPKYFSRQFKKYFGINPGQYRNIHHYR
jgi:two-component system response regulator YesN